MAKQTTVAEMFVKLGADATEVKGALRQFTREVKKGATKANKNMKGLSRGFQRSADSVKRFGLAIIGAFGIRSIGIAIKGTIQLGDQLAKLSDKLGVSVEFLDQMRFASARSGVEFKTFTTGIQRAIRRLEEFRSFGTGEAAKALDSMSQGFQLAVKRGESFEKLLPLLADEFKGMDTQARRVFIAMKLFDTEGVSLINVLQDGSEGLKAFTDRLEELGGPTSEAFVRATEKWQDQALDFKTSWHNGLRAVVEDFQEFLDLHRQTPQGSSASVNTAAPGAGPGFNQQQYEAGERARRAALQREISSIQEFMESEGMPIDAINIPTDQASLDILREAVKARKELNAKQEQKAIDIQEIIDARHELKLFTQSFIDLKDGSVESLMRTGEAFDVMMARVVANTEEMTVQKEFMDQWAESVSINFENIMGAIRGVFDTFSQGIGQAVSQVVVDGANAADVFMNLLKAVAKQIVATLVRMAVQFLIFQLIARQTAAAVGSAFIKASTARSATAAVAAGFETFGLGGFLSAAPLAAAAIAATISAGSAGAAAGAALGLGIQSAAQGGITRGPTLLLAGDNPGGKELLAPLGPGGAIQTIQVILDGRVLAESVFEGLPSVARIEGIRI